MPIIEPILLIFSGRERPVLEWSNRLKIALGSAKGLAYLHEDCKSLLNMFLLVETSLSPLNCSLSNISMSVILIKSLKCT